MTLSKIPSAEFLALTEKYLSGEITAEELSRWERLCLTDEVALDYYLTLARTEALIPNAIGRLDVADARGRVIPFYRKTAVLAGWVASLALAALAGFAWVRFKPASTPSVASGQVPARVTGAVGVRWVSTATASGSRPAVAANAISAGLLELTLDSGVRVLVQGPASFAVTGPNALRLENGRAVADVPLNARGFTLTSPRDRIVDHGTRFAVDVSPGGAETTLGVLSGEVEFFNGDNDVRLFTDYAVRREGDSVRSVPFDKSRFVTETPGREFAWSLDGDRLDTPRTLRYDVTDLIHGPGDYRAVVRWLLGTDAIIVKSLRLERDGVVVARGGDVKSGDPGLTHDNAPVLHVSESDYHPGRWSLVADAYAEGAPVSPKRPVKSSGAISFEEGLSVTADAKHYVGRWLYSHDGTDCEREFLADGTARFYASGKLTRVFDGARWSVKDGVLSLFVPVLGAVKETHMLRDDHTLVFLNRPYRNAHRE